MTVIASGGAGAFAPLSPSVSNLFRHFFYRLCGQVVWVLAGWLSRMIALRMMTIFRMTAVITSFAVCRVGAAIISPLVGEKAKSTS